ncbi:MAG: hypothetical protein NZ601_03290 [candidate division WOR-3 bacterium]|nr:hypothetical protein [candidate division WOR-3 bacterium]
MTRLSLVIVTPIIGILSYLIPKLRNEFCFLGSVLSLYFSLLIFNGTRQSLNFTKVLGKLGNHDYGLYADHFTAVVLILLSTLIFTTIIYSFRYLRGQKNLGLYYLYLLLMLAFSNAVLTFDSLLLAGMISFIVSILGYLIFTATSEKEKINLKLLYSFFTADLLFIIGCFFLNRNGTALVVNSSPVEFLPNFKTIFALILIFFSILMRFGFYPFNIYLIKNIEEFSLLGYLVFFSIVQKILGFYFLVRFSFFIFNSENLLWLQIVMVIFSVANIVLMSKTLWHTEMIKLLLIKNEAIQTGFVVLAFSRLDSHAFIGGVLLFVCFLLSQASIIYSLSSIHYWTKSEAIRDFSGFAEKMPVTFLLLGIATLLTIGFPPFGSFFARWFILKDLFSFSNTITAVLNALSIIGILVGNITIVGYFTGFLKEILEPVAIDISKAREIGFTAWISPLILLLLGFYLGAFVNKTTVLFIFTPLLKTLSNFSDLLQNQFELSNNLFPILIALSIIIGYNLHKKCLKQNSQKSQC